jgi:hypothetical protein
MSEMDVHKVTLSSGKVAYLRDMKIEDQELAAIAAGRSAPADNQLAMGVVMQKELLKILLIQVGEKKLSGSEKEDLNSLFSYTDYREITSVVGQIAGVDDPLGKLQIEHVSFGSI